MGRSDSVDRVSRGNGVNGEVAGRLTYLLPFLLVAKYTSNMKAL